MSVMKPKARARLISALLPIAACFQLSDFAAGAESPRPAATAPLPRLRLRRIVKRGQKQLPSRRFSFLLINHSTMLPEANKSG